MKKFLFLALFALAGCNGTLATDVTKGQNVVANSCADVSAIQPLLPQLAALLGVNSVMVNSVYAQVEGGCLTASQYSSLLSQVEAIIAKQPQGTATPAAPAAAPAAK